MWVFDAYVLLLALAGARWLMTVALEHRQERS